MIRLGLLILGITLSSIAFGQDLKKLGMNDSIPPIGIEVGQMAPSFMAVDQDGITVDMESKLKDGPIVLIFYRGAWCPYCVKYLLNVTDSLDQIESAGASIYAVTPQLIEGVKNVSNKTEGAIRILHDKDGAIMGAYDGDFVVTEDYQKRVNSKKMDLAKSNGQSEAKLPVPATYVINAKGEIVFRHFDYDYKNRASVKAILAALDR
ncbi:AhpC/TSA family protein [bacterium]|nr:AhpC/TSA family protein [bacterium]